VRSASKAGWGALLLAGAGIAEYEPTMFHCKVMIVDGTLTSLGSTNFDNRSFRLNDEATLNILDRGFAEQQTKVFDEDMRNARPVSFVEWSKRPLKERLSEYLATLVSSQL
jgi:cardiolipin synthase